MISSLKIGVLALQGAVDLHRPHIEACGAAFAAVKTPAQFETVDAFILPGGESTTMLKLIENFKLWDVLAEQFAQKPVWGICAGAILMAEKSFRTDNLSSRQDSKESSQTQKSFGLLPISVRRNGYGTQLESHMVEIENYPVSFIRAPVIVSPSPCSRSRAHLPLPEGRGKAKGESPEQGEGLKILAVHNDDPVWVQKGQYMASTFHPELTLDFPSPMHKAFIEDVRGKKEEGR